MSGQRAGAVTDTDSGPFSSASLRRGDHRQARGNTPLAISVRFLTAIAVAVLISDAIWSRVGHRLSVSTDIVGSTTFNAFDINRYLDAFYLITLGGPAIAIAAYAALARWGILRKPVTDNRRWPLDFSNHPWNEPREVAAPLAAVSLSARLLFPAVAVAMEYSLVASRGKWTYTHIGLVGGLGYIVTAVLLGVLLVWWRAPRGRPSWIWHGLKMALPRVNLALCLIVVPGLYWVSRRTNLYILSTHSDVGYQWFPAWALLILLALSGILLAAYWQRRPSTIQARRIESAILRYLVGAVIEFLILARLYPALGRFVGFDDSHYLVGAQLMFRHGLNPFKNLYLLHGVLADSFYGQIGITVFGNTRWGALNGKTLLIQPLTTVLMYWFAIYFARRNKLFTGVALLGLALGLVPALTIRFALLPPLLILLDRVLKRQSWGRSGAFMLLLVVECIVTPETGLLAIGLLGTIFVFDLAHRTGRATSSPTEWRSVPCLVWGVGLTATWAIYLASVGAMKSFLDYYITAVPGHQYEGSFPVPWNLSKNLADDVYYMLPVALFLITVLYAVVLVRRRLAWRTDDWVMVACSSFVPLYFTKAIDRLDMGHVFEVFTVTVPLLVLWSIRVLRWADGYFRRRLYVTIRGSVPYGQTYLKTAAIAFPVTLISCLVLAFGSTYPVKDVIKGPGGFYAESPVPAPTSQPKLGYTVPGTTDIAQIDALATVLNTYSGPSAPVYDFSGEVGVLYYLLNRVPASKFYMTQIVQTPYAQQIVIHDLEHSRPPLIVFNNSDFGLPVYDGLTTMERDYDISQYVLDHYKPVIDVGGQLLMLRNDLVNSRAPLPALGVPVRTANLYDDMPSCNWGDVPNFFPPPAGVTKAADQVSLQLMNAGMLEQVTVSGWAFDRRTQTAPLAIVATTDGAVVGETKQFTAHPDANSPVGSAAFSFGFVTREIGAAYSLYALNRDGTVTPFYIHGSDLTPAPYLKLPDGTSHRVTGRDTEGLMTAVGSAKSSSFRGAELSIPRDIDLASYQWLAFGTRNGHLGNETITITDSPGQADDSIRFTTLAGRRAPYYLQGGSCIQWHGYQAHNLYLVISGTPSELPSSVTLIRNSSQTHFRQ